MEREFNSDQKTCKNNALKLIPSQDMADHRFLPPPPPPPPIGLREDFIGPFFVRENEKCESYVNGIGYFFQRDFVKTQISCMYFVKNMDDLDSLILKSIKFQQYR